MAERTYCRAGAGCQLDCTLLPYYEKSVAEGMTDDEATFILACFLLCDPHYYQIGGPAADGSDNTNHLSYLILEAAHQLKSTANITIRVFDNMDEGLFRRGLEILFEDRLAYPRFSGDKALVSGFMKNGYSAELARRRIALGCNWMSLPGLEYTMNDLVKINMAKVFEVAFQEYQGDDLAEFYDVFRKDLLEAIACIKAGIDFHLKNQYRNAPELLLNLVSHGPIEKGRDASHGGLQYYNIAIDGAGIATVADSFAALELHCCEKKDLSWDQVRNAIAVNFEGPEADAVRRIRFPSGSRSARRPMDAEPENRSTTVQIRTMGSGRTAHLPQRPRRSPLSSPDTAIPRRSSWNSMTPSLTARMPLRM